MSEHERLPSRTKRQTVKEDLALTIWVELAVIEQGSAGIARHLHGLMTRSSLAERPETPAAKSRGNAQPTPAIDRLLETRLAKSITE